MKRLLLLLLIVMLPNVSVAGFYYEYGFLNGGDSIFRADQPANVFPGEDSVGAGSGQKLGIGIHNLLGLRGTRFYTLALGYLGDSLPAVGGGDALLETVTFDGIYGIRFNPHRLGIGLTLHRSPDFKQDIDPSFQSSIGFEDAFGIILQYSYEVTPVFNVGIRYVDMDYETEDETFNANGIGFLLMITAF